MPVRIAIQKTLIWYKGAVRLCEFQWEFRLKCRLNYLEVPWAVPPYERSICLSKWLLSAKSVKFMVRHFEYLALESRWHLQGGSGIGQGCDLYYKDPLLQNPFLCESWWSINWLNRMFRVLILALQCPYASKCLICSYRSIDRLVKPCTSYYYNVNHSSRATSMGQRKRGNSSSCLNGSKKL